MELNKVEDINPRLTITFTMLFYPDQYFYNRLQQPRSKPSQRRSFHSKESSDSSLPLAELFGGNFAPHVQGRRGSYIPDEYIVLDEGELSALRAYRERQRRLADDAERREAVAARRRAEQQRQAMEFSRQQEEARLQARVEAKARAAAREYVRRKQAQQIAIQKAQQEERQLRQQFILEQLRNQFGMFMAPQQSGFQTSEDEVEGTQPVTKEASEDAENKKDAEAPKLASTDQESRQSQISDPIRTLLEALAPYPISFVTSESSDEDEMSAEEVPPASSPAVDSENLVHEAAGPTCETASEDETEPAYVEFNDPFAHPPQSHDGMSSSSDLDEEQVHGFKKGRSKERQQITSADRLKKAKHNESRRSSKKSSPGISSSSSKTTSATTAGQLTALEEDLQRLNDAYNRLKDAVKPSNYKEAVSRVEGVKIGYRRTEEIYSKLDQMKIGKDYRKLKHQITSNSVALADKYEELLQKANDIRMELVSKHNAENVKHQVTLEEVDDESDAI